MNPCRHEILHAAEERSEPALHQRLINARRSVRKVSSLLPSIVVVVFENQTTSSTNRVYLSRLPPLIHRLRHQSHQPQPDSSVTPHPPSSHSAAPSPLANSARSPSLSPHFRDESCGHEDVGFRSGLIAGDNGARRPLVLDVRGGGVWKMGFGRWDWGWGVGGGRSLLFDGYSSV